MRYFKTLGGPKATLVGLLALLQILPAGCVQPPADSQLVEQTENFTGTADVNTERVTPFTLEGTEPHIGQYVCHGEVRFLDGEEPGSFTGNGVAVFETTDGDKLVGVVTWEIDAASGDDRASRIQFSWRDSVEFSDGTTALTTGHFVDDRPPGLVVIAIIAILIGLLVPAVQK
jgi:hypothetical protein